MHINCVYVKVYSRAHGFRDICEKRYNLIWAF